MREVFGMGGMGSGRWYRWDKKTTTEEVRRVDIRYLSKHGLLRIGYTGNLSWSIGGEQTGSIRFRVERDYFVLMYRHRVYDDDWQDIEESVWIDRTPCNYGGERLWFLCPQCQTRVAVLYGAGARFLCRHCYDIPYSSQQESYIDRMMRKARKVRHRLGASDNLMEPIYEKPKGMHWKTFGRLLQEESKTNRAAAFAMGERMGMLEQLGHYYNCISSNLS